MMIFTKRCHGRPEDDGRDKYAEGAEDLDDMTTDIKTKQELPGY